MLILADDGSNDGTADMVSRFPFRKEICHGNGKLWWAGGIRKGLARLKALDPRPDDLVLIANSDTTFQSNFLEKAVRRDLRDEPSGNALRVGSVY